MTPDQYDLMLSQVFTVGAIVAPTSGRRMLSTLFAVIYIVDTFFN